MPPQGGYPVGVYFCHRSGGLLCLFLNSFGTIFEILAPKSTFPKHVFGSILAEFCDAFLNASDEGPSLVSIIGMVIRI